MNLLSKLGIAGAMMGSLAFAAGSAAGNVFRPSFGTKGFRGTDFVHPTKKGPGRSRGVKRLSKRAGSKIARQAFNGKCTLRNGCGAAGRLAIERKLGRK